VEGERARGQQVRDDALAALNQLLPRVATAKNTAELEGILAEMNAIAGEAGQGLQSSLGQFDLLRRFVRIRIEEAAEALGNLDQTAPIKAQLEAVREALRRCELLVISGGLGPTADDKTMASIAEAVGLPLTQRTVVLTRIRRFYRRRSRKVHPPALRQALLPEGGIPLPNPLGTAPGLWLSLPSTTIVALPGVPAELFSILNRSVLPRLKRHPSLNPPASAILRTIGIVELDIERRLKRLLRDKLDDIFVILMQLQHLSFIALDAARKAYVFQRDCHRRLIVVHHLKSDNLSVHNLDHGFLKVHFYF